MIIDAMDQREMAIRDNIIRSMHSSKIYNVVQYKSGDKTVVVEIEQSGDNEWIKEAVQSVCVEYAGDPDLVYKLYALLARKYYNPNTKISEFNPDGSGTTVHFNQ